MKQLFLFQEEKTDTVTSKKAHWKIFIDGASRGNPGPAGTGIYVLKDSEPHASYAFYLGKKTNNQAEYYALLIALFFILPETIQDKSRHDKIEIISDSQLLVRQIQAVYKVHDIHLKKLHEKALKLLDGYIYSIKHVLRAENKDADALANKGVDCHIPLPEKFTSWIVSHDNKN